MSRLCLRLVLLTTSTSRVFGCYVTHGVTLYHQHRAILTISQYHFASRQLRINSNIRIDIELSVYSNMTCNEDEGEWDDLKDLPRAVEYGEDPVADSPDDHLFPPFLCFNVKKKRKMIFLAIIVSVVLIPFAYLNVSPTRSSAGQQQLNADSSDVPGHDISPLHHHKHLLLIGQTGAGKSSLGNEMVGLDFFEVGHSLDSCTSTISKSDNVFLFGDPSTKCKISVSDTGGLGDSEGRDDTFLDQLALHIRKDEGVHGIGYVHNAGTERLDKHAKDTLRTMVATLTTPESREELSKRLSIIVTKCNRVSFMLKYSTLSTFLCKEMKLCNVPLICYDDFIPGPISSRRLPVLRRLRKWVGLGPSFSPWQKDIVNWTRNLPMSPMNIPSETERQKLHQKHAKEVKEEEDRIKDLKDQLSATRSAAHESTKRMKELEEELRQLENRNGCFSPLSKVFVLGKGEVELRDLQNNDFVASKTGWTRVYTFVHWHSSQPTRGLHIIHEYGEMTLTPNHLVFDHEGTARPASSYHPGTKMLWNQAGIGFIPSVVTDVSLVSMPGYSAPLTVDGSILVDGILASCYMHMDPNVSGPKFSLPHWMLHSMMVAARNLDPRIDSYMPPEGVLNKYIFG